MKLKLLYCHSYINSTPELRKQAGINGCGPKRPKWLASIIPDTIFGVSCTPACSHHDWMYATGQNRFIADLVMFINLMLTTHYTMHLVNSKWEKAFRWCVTAPANIAYFAAVRLFGWSFYKKELDGFSDDDFSLMEQHNA